MTNNYHKTIIIAEAGVNHNGSLSLAKELIEMASQSGADYVKFQTFLAEELSTNHAPMAQYQMDNTKTKTSQSEMLKKLELPLESFVELSKFAKSKKIGLLSTPFDRKSLDYLTSNISMDYLKISSGDLNNLPFLAYVALKKIPIILSTGMASTEEIRDALDLISYVWHHQTFPKNLKEFEGHSLITQGLALIKKNVSILHCNTQYPTPVSDINLNSILYLKDKFAADIGFSDHSLGITAPIAAVALGAKIIEKHFTLDKNMPGPDHLCSLNGDELKEMVEVIREVEMSLGSFQKIPSLSEIPNQAIVRKSLVASSPIRVGEVFLESNITTKRPGSGMSPKDLWKILGRKASKDYKKDDLIKE